MRYSPSESCKFDQQEVKELRVPEWMLNVLKTNPDYCFWGPHEDYMCDKDAGWGSPIFFNSWQGFGFGLDDLNEVVNFYFEVSRESKTCPHCDGTNYNPETKQISEDWYDFGRTGARWCDNIGQEEVDALWEAGRLKPVFGHKPTPEEVNLWERGTGFGHDAINRFICIEARARKLGVYGDCQHCEHEGYDYVQEEPSLNLVLWVLHPRKGASRGIEVKNIEEQELPDVYAYLRQAADRNANRFSRIPDGDA